MQTMSREKQRVAIVISLLVVLVALRFRFPNWPWPYFAAALALIAAVLTVVSEERRAFGDDYESPEEKDKTEKVSARNWSRVLMAIALAFVFFSAIVPVLELPGKDGINISAVTFTDHDGKQRLNPNALKGVLTQLDTEIQQVANRDPGASLLVQNCGNAVDCACPEGHQAVPYSGEWNLNDKTSGSTIRLCSKR